MGSNEKRYRTALSRIALLRPDSNINNAITIAREVLFITGELEQAIIPEAPNCFVDKEDYNYDKLK